MKSGSTYSCVAGTAQEIYGYLPEDIIKLVAKEMRIPVSEVFGVATLYSQFTIYPTWDDNIIRVCMGTACHVRGALISAENLGARVGHLKPDATNGDGKIHP